MTAVATVVPSSPDEEAQIVALVLYTYGDPARTGTEG